MESLLSFCLSVDLEIKLRSSGLCGKCFYSPSYLSGPFACLLLVLGIGSMNSCMLGKCSTIDICLWPRVMDFTMTFYLVVCFEMWSHSITQTGLVFVCRAEWGLQFVVILLSLLLSAGTEISPPYSAHMYIQPQSLMVFDHMHPHIVLSFLKCF